LIAVPKMKKVTETYRTQEAEEMLAAIRSEQEQRCVVGNTYQTDKNKMSLLSSNNTGKSFTYSLQETGATASREEKDYEIKMISYKTGALCCEGDGCAALNKGYPACTEEAVQAARADECAGEGVCDVEQKPSNSQACSSGDGLETRDVYCSSGVWRTTPWDKSNCGCELETRPVDSQNCRVGAGTETRSVSCNEETKEWVIEGDWDISACTCDPDAQPVTSQNCTAGVGTETRSVSCNEETKSWDVTEWDNSACTCDPNTRPVASQNCTVGVGTETRSVSCNNETKAWDVTSWDNSSCTCDPAARPNETRQCTNGIDGNETHTVTCEGTTWVEGAWDASGCSCGEFSCDGSTCGNRCGSISSFTYGRMQDLTTYLGEDLSEYTEIYADDPACNNGAYGCGTLCKDDSHEDCVTYLYDGSMTCRGFSKTTNGVKQSYFYSNCNKEWRTDRCYGCGM
jgi:hypothetical protein